MISPDFRYLQANNKYCDISGYPRDELLNMQLDDVSRPSGLSTYFPLLAIVKSRQCAQNQYVSSA